MQMTLNDYKMFAFLPVVALLATASIGNQNASGKSVLTRAKNAASDRPVVQMTRLVWLDNYQAAIQQSKATGKPIFLEFRCGP